MPEIEVDEEVAMALDYGSGGDVFDTKNELLREIMTQRGWIRAAKRANNNDQLL